MKLLELYKALLKAANLETNKEGLVSLSNPDGSKSPVCIKGDRLALPTPENLSNKEGHKITIFHPLAENFLESESVILEKYRQWMNIKLNMSIARIAVVLFNIARNVEIQKKLNPHQLEVLRIIKNVDEKTISNFEKIVENLTIGEKNKTFIHIFLRRSPVLKGSKYNRGGIVSFPFYEELIKAENNKIYGVDIRVKDKQAYLSFFEYLFQNIKEPHAYSVGSNDLIAPFLDALMHAIKNIAVSINDVVSLFSDQFVDVEAVAINSDWVETFNDLSVMTKEIKLAPPQKSNTSDEQIQSKTDVMQNIYNEPATQQQTQVNKPHPLSDVGLGKHPMGQPGGYIPQPQYQMPAPIPVVQQPSVPRTKDGLDMRGIMQNVQGSTQGMFPFGGPVAVPPMMGGNNNQQYNPMPLMRTFF